MSRAADTEAPPLPPHGTAPRKPAPADDSALLPCRFCQAPTKRETLSAYGGRCWRCYESWLAQAFAHLPRKDRFARGSMTPAAYCAARLRSLGERGGKPLTDAQIAVRDACEQRAGMAEEVES